MTDNNELPGIWKKLQVISQILSILLVPVLIAMIGGIINNNLQRDQLAKEYVFMALDILKQPPTPETEELRRWAVDTVNSYAQVKMTDTLKQQIESQGIIFSERKIIDTSKTDTGVYLCASQAENPRSVELAEKIANGILSSNKFGSSYARIWQEEGELTQENIAGRVTIVFDENHDERFEVADLKRVVQDVLASEGYDLEVVEVPNPSDLSEWFISVVVCP